MEPKAALIADTTLAADALRSFMVLFQTFVGVMLAFGTLMARAMVFSMMAVNVAERSVELTTLRVAVAGFASYQVPPSRLDRSGAVNLRSQVLPCHVTM